MARSGGSDVFIVLWRHYSISGYNLNMSKRQIIMAFGALAIVVTLFPGFPASLERLIVIVSGLIVIVAAYMIKHEAPVEAAAPASSAASRPDPATYVDHKSDAPLNS